jgi:hypothetical protein
MSSDSDGIATVRFLAGLGLAAAGLGVVVGLRMALHATVVTCPDGTYFPQDETDFRCFAHHGAGIGTGLVVLSVMLAVLIVICSVCATVLLQRRISERNALKQRSLAGIEPLR